MKRLISNKTLWPLHVRQGRAEEISAWVAANGIEPDDVSTDHALIVEGDPAGRVIRHRAFLRTLDGAKYHVDGDGPASEERTVRLTVEPPEHWPTWALTDEEQQ